SSINRTLSLTFIAFLIYALIAVGSTTDLMLLIPDTPLNLPIININLPLVPFYVILPIFIFGLHLNLLINLLEHRRKLYRWHKIIEDARQDVDKAVEWLQPFLFNQALMKGSNTIDHIAEKILTEVSAYFLPLFLLLFIQFRFSDYQYFSVTAIHSVIFILDAGLIFYYRALIQAKNQSNNKAFQLNWENGFLHFILLERLVVRVVNLWEWIKWKFSKQKPTSPYKSKSKLAINWFGFFSTPVFWFTMMYSVLNAAIVGCCTSHDVNPKLLSFLTSHNCWYWVYKPYLDVHGATLVKKAPPDNMIAEVRKNSIDSSDVIDLWVKTSEGIDFSNRCFRWANFSGCKLFGAIFNDAQLQGANLNNAQLQAAIFLKANFQGCDLYDAELQGARMNGAQLQGVDMNHAQLQGIYLTGAKLWGASLQGVQFLGANLIGTQFQGADLKGGQFKETNLMGAQLQGAYLAETLFEGVYLEEASFAFDLPLKFHKCYFHSLPRLTDQRFELSLTQYEEIPEGTRRESFIKNVNEARSNLNKNLPPSVNFTDFLSNRLSKVCDENFDFHMLYLGAHSHNDPNVKIYSDTLIRYTRIHCNEKLPKKFILLF
ncbi:MAG: pentapeptide repeat-containing protein, partial [Bacteroidia bacterium]